MKLFKPNWISHDGQPIFSIDIHPDGSRFATGGLGDGGSSGKVIIWNMTPVVNPKDEDSNDVPKVLCVMDNHLACVNSVRWSCNGRYLASGGDDRLIMIWQFAGYGGVGVFGGSASLQTTNGERWRCTHTLKGHTGDVLDLSWSPANQWLASCSIDNSVIIWNAEKFPEVTTVLKGHSSLVKGVTWDPIGTYVASQSDDKTVKIWKTLDWKLDTTITKPFKECTATTHVLRLSWSPDGGYLVSAHAMNNSGPTAQIIQREGWVTDMDFVGHRKAITCTRFNGCVFSNPSSDEGKKSTLPYTCCAVGSRDRAISVWLTSLRRPLVVIHDLFEDSVMDISWSFDGYKMLCCSWDGTVAFLSFDKPEIGQTLTQEEKNKLHKDTYGKTSCVQQPLVIENPALLALQQKKNEQASTLADQVNKPPPIPHNYPTKQIETRTASGKRRIIPVFVAPQEALGGIPCPFGSNSAFGRPPSTSSLINSSLKKSPEICNKSPSKSISSKEDTRSPAKQPTEKVADSIKAIEIQKEKQSPAKQPTADAEQKKKAVLDSRLCEKSTDAVKSNDAKIEQITAESEHIKATDLQLTAPPAPTPISQPPKAPTPPQPSPRRPGRPPLHLKRKMNGSTSPVRKRQYRQMRKDHTKAVGGDGEPQSHEQVPARKETPALSHKTTHTSRHADPHLLPHKKLAKKLIYQSPPPQQLVVTSHNELTSDDKPVPSALHRVECTCDKIEQWSSVLSSPAVALSVSQHIVGLACNDHSIHSLSLTSGRRLFPPIHFGSAISHLNCKGHHLVAVDSTCKISVWDTKNCKAVVNERSFAHLLDDGCHGNKNASPLKKCFVTQRGLPVVTLTNGKTFSFNQDICTWVLIHSASDSVGLFSDSVGVETDDHCTEEAALLLAKKSFNGMGAQASRSSHTSASSQRNATLAMLESKVAACVLLESVTEYRKWMLAYVRYLVQENLELRLREVCNDLIGPPAQRSWAKTRNRDSSSWKAHVLGIQKQALLQEEVLPIIASNLAFQRLYTEYQDQLDSQTLPTLPGLNMAG